VIGDRIELSVGAVAPGGHCVARTADGQVVFVRHALPGERVVAEITEEHKGYLRADAVEVHSASPDRVAPPCPYAGVCGGSSRPPSYTSS
jgi:tRNA/tmRNA/rRNA uracil-C5-methylase (TrmA/RlmC/RlmD family)